MATEGFVNPAIGSAANESNNFVLLNNSGFGLVCYMARSPISRIYGLVSGESKVYFSFEIFVTRAS
jgi:hypothetical protein